MTMAWGKGFVWGGTWGSYGVDKGVLFLWGGNRGSYGVGKAVPMGREQGVPMGKGFPWGGNRGVAAPEDDDSALPTGSGARPGGKGWALGGPRGAGGSARPWGCGGGTGTGPAGLPPVTASTEHYRGAGGVVRQKVGG